MKLNRLLGLCTALTLLGELVCVESIAQSSRPDFSGKWILVEGDTASSSPLFYEGTIKQDESTVTFELMRVPFDKSVTPSSFYEGQWIGKTFVVSMTQDGYTDLMVVSPSAENTITMVIMRNTLAPAPGLPGVMKTSTLKYKKI